MKKRILFISALDFKEKSIQVIRNTPEAFVNAGWDVHYVVLRDNSKLGDYFYEDVINPTGINIYREEFPLTNLKNKTNAIILLSILRIFSNYIGIFKLFRMSRTVMKTQKFDVVYGYEAHGIWAAKLLNFFKKFKTEKFVARFQGTFYNKYLDNKNWKKILFNIEVFSPLYLNSDLCIMTNDGTQGDKVLARIKSRHQKNLKFWVNGVDLLKLDDNKIFALRNELSPGVENVILSISRLEKWKRLDRGILSIAKYVENTGDRNFKYIIVGDGIESNALKQLVKDNNLENEIEFTGAIPHTRVKEYLNIADVFLSLYDGSNVGNPLLEAIRTHKIIFTLNNGDTASWIQHKKNGFIFDENENLLENISSEIENLFSGKYNKEEILTEIVKTEKTKLWTWEERMNEEVAVVENLIMIN
ncbi:MAG: glycosyltransferase involved in cell wall biosynthesis [Planctomycetota bacterium]|jgi:glycosyltransferase involved in cell wall biosynthesis